MRILFKLNLVVVFTLIFWHAGAPFTGALFQHRSKDILFQWVMGSPELGSRLHLEDLMKRNQDRFLHLNEDTKTRIVEGHIEMGKKLDEAWWLKIQKSFKILLFELPPLERLWLVLSFSISLFGLIGIEGVAQAAILLPAVALLFISENQIQGETPRPSAEIDLYPSENWIQEKYIKGTLGKSIAEQKENLTKGLNLYFIYEWAKEEPSTDREIFQQQVEKGQYFFHLARATKLIDELVIDSKIIYEKRSFVTLFFFFIWNLFFVVKINKKKELITLSY